MFAGAGIDASVQGELQALAIQTVGVLAAPAWFAQVTALPQTRTGKYLRRLLREIVCSAAESEDDESESGSHVTNTRGGGGSSSSSSSSSSSRVSSAHDKDDGALCNPESLQEARAAVAAIQAAQAMRRRTSSCRDGTQTTSAKEGEEGEGEGGEELRRLVVSLASDAVSWEVGSGQPSADDAKGHHDDDGLDDGADPAVSSQTLIVRLSTLQTVSTSFR
eukprot:COSAG06_NODE_2486_length_6776_cov_5.224652_6_plen_220_part_00